MIQLSQVKSKTDANSPLPYSQVEKSTKFKELMQEKKRFIIPLTVFFLLFYFSLPILASYTTILNKPAIGSITWVWILALAQFVMTWTLCILYVRKAARFDQKADDILSEYKGGRST